MIVAILKVGNLCLIPTVSIPLGFFVLVCMVAQGGFLQDVSWDVSPP